MRHSPSADLWYNAPAVLGQENDFMSNDTFDLKRIKQLVELMRVNDLTELDIQQGESQIKIRRGGQPFFPGSSAVPLPAVPVQENPARVNSSAGSSPVSAAAAEPVNSIVISSPMVGTFYASPDPKSPPFVKAGDTVTPEKTVCLIEAMKVYNEIQAECSGTIIAVLAANGETVEFGKPLFRVQI